MDAELISKRKESDGRYRFYVHYVDCNRRLDEWVNEEQLDLFSVRIPQKVRKQPTSITEPLDIQITDIEYVLIFFILLNFLFFAFIIC